MGLFWIRPNQFISLDGKMRDYLGIELPKDGLSFDFYRETLNRVLQTRKEDLPHLSYAAHLARMAEEQKLPSHHQAHEINNEIDYCLVGAYWSDADPQDQTERFLAEGIWKNGWKDRFLDQVRGMKVGDRIAIKATFTQKHGRYTYTTRTNRRHDTQAGPTLNWPLVGTALALPSNLEHSLRK